MPKSTDTCNKVLNLMYRAAAWANVADNAASAPLTNVYVALHTATLTAATNSQAENEVAYTNYARQAVARSTGWSAGSGGSTNNAALLQFPQSGATGATLAAVSTGTTDRQLDAVPQSPQPSQTASLITTRRPASGIRPRLRRRRFSAAQTWS